MRKLIGWCCFLMIWNLNAQSDTLVLEFREFLGYVKKYHPVARQAALTIPIGQANLMKARGGFDPKIEVDYQQKKFKGTEYWDRLNATFKIPTWFGLEIKGNFEQSEGEFINPDEFLPVDGLYSAGVSMSLGRGFWINERMATLKKAKFFREQTRADQDLLVNQVLYNAAVAYFDWLRAYQDALIFHDFLTNAQIRFEGVKKSALLGEVAMIDTVEAKIAVRNRALGLEQTKIRLLKKSLDLSNFLWINEVPVELQPGVIPELNLEKHIDDALEITKVLPDSLALEDHPKLRSLAYKMDRLSVDKRLKVNQLLPNIDLEYNFLSETPEEFSSFNTREYKAGLSFRFPLFLRKERGELRLAKYKLVDAGLERLNARIEIQNKLRGLYSELDSFITQNEFITNIVADYTALLRAEDRKFGFGESSLFLINSRESRLIDAKLKQNELKNKYFRAKAELFKSLAISPKNL